MTDTEIRDLNQKMFEAFKPENVQWFDLSKISSENEFDGCYFKQGQPQAWSPATSVDDALACRPAGMILELTISDHGTSATLRTPFQSWEGGDDDTAAAICEASLKWREHENG